MPTNTTEAAFDPSSTGSVKTTEIHSLPPKLWTHDLHTLELNLENKRLLQRLSAAIVVIDPKSPAENELALRSWLAVREERPDTILFPLPLTEGRAKTQHLSPLEPPTTWLRAGHLLFCALPFDATQKQKSLRALITIALAAEAPILIGHCARIQGDADATWSLRLGSPLSLGELDASNDVDAYLDVLRWHHHAIELCPQISLHAHATTQALSAPLAIAAEVSAEAILAEIADLPAESALVRTATQSVFRATAEQIPYCLQQIGRLRELTFRAEGEGTGKSVDLDEFDAHYLHLFVFDHTENEILGAYRIRQIDETILSSASQSLYTSTLFDYDASFFKELGPALELGRSFVIPSAQKSSRTLMLLWKGIAKLVSRHPGSPTLLGPVSISTEYRSFSRELIACVLGGGAHRHPLSALVRPRRPWSTSFSAPEAEQLQRLFSSPKQLSSLVSDAEPDHKSLPVLLREYLRLGGRFLAFNVDPDFADVLDGLVAVDLKRTDPRLLQFYMGQEALRFSAPATPDPT